MATNGWMLGLSSVLLAALLSLPLAWAFERGGRSIAGPALLHTSSNAPVLIFALPEDLMASALLAHMGVIVISLWTVFRPAQSAVGGADALR